MAVGFLCQRSTFGFATNPQRRANVRTTGISGARRKFLHSTEVELIYMPQSFKTQSSQFRTDSEWIRRDGLQKIDHVNDQRRWRSCLLALTASHALLPEGQTAGKSRRV